MCAGDPGGDNYFQCVVIWNKSSHVVNVMAGDNSCTDNHANRFNMTIAPGGNAHAKFSINTGDGCDADCPSGAYEWLQFKTDSAHFISTGKMTACYQPFTAGIVKFDFNNIKNVGQVQVNNSGANLIITDNSASEKTSKH